MVLSGTPTGGLETPCRSVIKDPPYHKAHTHSFHPTKRGSRQLDRQTCRGAGTVGGRGMLIEVVRGCMFPPESPAAKSIWANSPSAVPPPPPMHMYTKSHMNTHLCLP